MIKEFGKIILESVKNGLSYCMGRFVKENMKELMETMQREMGR